MQKPIHRYTPLAFRRKHPAGAPRTARAIMATLVLSAALAAPSAAAHDDNPVWVGTWATALTPASTGDRDWGRSHSGFQDESIRMIVQPSIGGNRVRVRLSNRFGEQPLVIGRATLARPADPPAPDLVPHSIRKLSFNGSPSVVIPAGGEVFSDPLHMFVIPLTELAVTLYLPQATGPTSWHLIAKQTAYIYDGDRAADPDGDVYSETFEHFYFLAGIEVGNRWAPGSVAVYGASISDGFGGTTDANTRWPDFLARRLLVSPPFFRDPGVLNVSISGNPVTHDGAEIDFPEFGVNGLERLAVDVYPRPDIRTVIVDLGLNDIFQHDDPPGRIIDGLRAIVADLHQHNLRVLLATLSPAAGPDTWTEEREQTRQAVNAYIRTTHEADGVVDIDRALRDPDDPTRLNPLFRDIDDVHPNDLGNRAIADAVPLHLLY